MNKVNKVKRRDDVAQSYPDDGKNYKGAPSEGQEGPDIIHSEQFSVVSL